MQIIDATFWTDHRDPERYGAGECLHPELPEFIQGSFLQANLMHDHERIAAWLSSLNGIATMDYEPEHFTDQTGRMLLFTVMAASRIYAVAGVPCLNYDFTRIDFPPIASVQTYAYNGVADRAWYEAAAKKYDSRLLGSGSRLTAVWLNTHLISTTGNVDVDYRTKPVYLKQARMMLSLASMLGADYAILWGYRLDEFSADLPMFVAAKEMMS